MDVKTTIESKISSLLRENQTLKNEREEIEKKFETKIDDIFREFLTVIDTFDRAEQVIKEKEWVQNDNAQKAVNRLLNAKKKALFVFEKYSVNKIVFEDNHSIEELCEVSGTEPDSSKQEGDIVAIEKEGYTRNGHLLRPAEVIIVKN